MLRESASFRGRAEIKAILGIIYELASKAGAIRAEGGSSFAKFVELVIVPAREIEALSRVAGDAWVLDEACLMAMLELATDQ